MSEKKYSKAGLMLFFLKGSKRYFILSILSAFLVTVLDLINPQIISFTVDYVIDRKKPDFKGLRREAVSLLGGVSYLKSHLYIIALVVVCVAAVAALFRYLFVLNNSKGSEKLVMTMRNSLFEHIENLPYSWHMENKTGDIIQRCTSDVETVKVFLSEQLTSTIRIIILIISALIFMAGMNRVLTGVALIYIPILLLYAVYFFGKFGREFKKADEEEGNLSSIAQENLTGVRVVRAFGRERYERDKFQKQNEYYFGLWRSINTTLSWYFSSADLFSGLQVLTVVLLGAWLAVKGQITAGEYIAFFSYNTMLIWPVRMLGRIISQMSKAGVSINRIAYIMNSETEKDREDAKEVPMDSDIEFDDVTFGFGDRKILNHLSLRIKAGSTVGILGKTGSGKSTIANLLLRMYDLEEGNGKITIGGIDIRNIKRSYLRKNIGLVLQEPYLFSRSLEENIGISINKKSHELIRDAARTASLLDTIESFPEGFDTEVGERGVTLSGGQKQRAAIAQMIISNTPVRIFDDSLSAVDAETDARIREALAEKNSGATTILIAHRITTIMNADDIIVLDNGRVAEEGTHEELLRRNGLYRKVYDVQTGGEEDE